MNLVWHHRPMAEDDWIRDLLSRLPVREVVDLDFTSVEEDSVHVLSTFERPLVAYRPYFERCRAACRRVSLFHISDEWFSGGYGTYALFDHVIRTFRAPFLVNPGVTIVPVGYSSGTPARSWLRADHRTHAWAFVGARKSSRGPMLRHMAAIGPAYLRVSPIQSATRSEYFEALADAVFAPCPMGNVLLETMRLYEALELGCIPIVERRPTRDYHRDLFGPHPIPTVADWSAGADFCRERLADPHGLVALQGEVTSWWRAHKEALRQRLAEVLGGPSQADSLRLLAARATPVGIIGHEVRRLTELLRHQSFASTLVRLSKTSRAARKVRSDMAANLADFNAGSHRSEPRL